MPVPAPAFPFHLFIMETNHMKTIEAVEAIEAAETAETVETTTIRIPVRTSFSRP